jgi:hypothetical protein
MCGDRRPPHVMGARLALATTFRCHAKTIGMPISSSAIAPTSNGCGRPRCCRERSRARPPTNTVPRSAARPASRSPHAGPATKQPGPQRARRCLRTGTHYPTTLWYNSRRLGAGQIRRECRQLPWRTGSSPIRPAPLAALADRRPKETDHPRTHHPLSEAIEAKIRAIERRVI